MVPFGPFKHQHPLLRLQLVDVFDLDLHDPEHRVFVLRVDDLPLSIAPLLLFFVHHWARLQTHDAHAALEQPLVDVLRLAGALGVVGLCVLRAGLERVVPAAQDAGAVEAQHVARGDPVHVEWEPQCVAFGQEVGEAADVRDYVVWLLGGEAWEESLQGVREHERAGEGVC